MLIVLRILFSGPRATGPLYLQQRVLAVVGSWPSSSDSRVESKRSGELYTQERSELLPTQARVRVLLSIEAVQGVLTAELDRVLASEASVVQSDVRLFVHSP